MPDRPPADPPPTRTVEPAADTLAPATESVAVPPDRAAFPFLAPPRAADEAGRFGGYRVLGVLGQGGMGVVFRAEDPDLRREVAVKVMLPQFAGVPAARGRFLREARSQARVEHDHVAAIHRVGEDRGIPFLVMPLLKGFSLAAALRANPWVPVGEALRIAREIAEGLAAAHETGLIHRDIKPGNVWLEGDRRRVKILDFGLARTVGGADAGADPFDPQTASGALIGTPAYMSPEQANGLVADARTDLFSLGAVLYQMLAGRPPFQAPTLTAMLVAVAHDAPPPPSAFNPAVPPGLDRVVGLLMAKNPADRPPAARAAVEVLRRAGEDLAATAVAAAAPPPLAPPAPAPDNAWSGLDPVPLDTPPPAPPRPGRLGLPLLAGGLAALAVFAVGLVLVLRDPNPPPATEPDATRPARTTSRTTPTPPRATPPTDDPPPPRNPGASTDPLVKEDFFNVYGMRFRIVPKGTAWLGSRGGAAATREVTIPHDFMLGQFEVTQGEWESVMQKNPSHFSPAGAGAALVRGYAPKERERLPVERVSWDDCQEYIRRVNAQAKEVGWVYRLPTADEWEYACRGGPGQPRADYDFDYYLSRPTRRITLGDARFSPSWGSEKPRVPVPVGSYRGSANRLGLYDMHGNVWEWCHDPGPPDPDDPQKVPRRFHRGGGWANDEDVCQAAVSSDCPAADVDNAVGFRLARVPAAPPPKVAPLQTHTNLFDMRFVKVPGGTTWLGGGGGQPGTREAGLPYDYFLGECEVTQAQWRAVMDAGPSEFSRTGARKDAVRDLPDGGLARLPVESVSWDDCQEFVRRVNQRAAARPDETGWVYRLPTEAEWEHACRGGQNHPESARFHFYARVPADILKSADANVAGPDSLGRPRTVGEYPPNRLGLRDMHGNVWEWCLDPAPAGPGAAARRVRRGGSWNHPPESARASSRVEYPAADRDDAAGLRLARVPAQYADPFPAAKPGPPAGK